MAVLCHASFGNLGLDPVFVAERLLENVADEGVELV